MIDQISGHWRSATSFEPVCDQIARSGIWLLKNTAVYLVEPGNDGAVGRLEAGSHEQADALVSNATQVGDVAQKLEQFGVRLVVERVNQHVAMPTTAETDRTAFNYHGKQRRRREFITRIYNTNSVSLTPLGSEIPNQT